MTTIIGHGHRNEDEDAKLDHSMLHLQRRLKQFMMLKKVNDDITGHANPW